MLRALALLLVTISSLLAAPVGGPRLPGDDAPKPQLLLLGTFHFKDAGLDGYKPKHPFGALAPARQKEIADVVARLAAFRPTHVALEIGAEDSASINDRYTKFLAGEFSIADRENEIYQLGFRLGQAAGLKQLDCVDAQGRAYAELPEKIEDFRAYAARHGEEALFDSPWEKKFAALYAADDEAKTQRPLRETLLYQNSESRLMLGHGHYLTGMFRAGAGDNYWGADNLVAYWYGRNLRIFANLLKLAARPEDRIVLIIGAGHVPVIRHAALASPEVELVEVSAVLGEQR